MKSLFPEYEKSLAQDRRAARREEIQRHREWVQKHDMVWLVGYLLDHGPCTEHAAMQAAHESEQDFEAGCKRAVEAICGLYSLWKIGKLWRRSVGIHPGSGEESFLYGIRDVHAVPDPQPAA